MEPTQDIPASSVENIITELVRAITFSISVTNAEIEALKVKHAKHSSDLADALKALKALKTTTPARAKRTFKQTQSKTKGVK